MRPSDDPDKQYAYTAAFRDIARRFVGAIKRIGDPDLSEQVSSLDLNISSSIVRAHDLRSKLCVVIDAMKEASANPDYAQNVAANAAFLNADPLLKLKALPAARFDPAKLVRMCEELNDAYARATVTRAFLPEPADSSNLRRVYNK